MVTDPDPGEVVTATLTLSSTAAGTLSLPTGSSYDVGTGVWTITGTVADVNTALAARTVPAGNKQRSCGNDFRFVTDGGEDGAASGDRHHRTAMSPA